MPGALTAAAYATVLAIALSLFGLIAWVADPRSDGRLAVPRGVRGAGPSRPHEAARLVQIGTRTIVMHVE